MNTAALSSLPIGRRTTGSASPDRARFAQLSRAMLDAGDFGTVAFTFAFVAGLVLSAALVCDAYLLAVVIQGVGSIEDVAGFQLARDLLPWACAFTAVAGCIAFFGLKAASLLRPRPAEQPCLRFGRV